MDNHFIEQLAEDIHTGFIQHRANGNIKTVSGQCQSYFRSDGRPKRIICGADYVQYRSSGKIKEISYGGKKTKFRADGQPKN